MKKTMRICALLLTICLLMSTAVVPAYSDDVSLTPQQQNAIAMLNYITVLTQEINASKNSRLYMEESYSSLINNTYPNAVDSRTQSQLTGLLDTMENYRMIAVKRDRLQFIYEQNQAQAIRAAVPSPLALMSAVQSFRPSKIALSLAYMAVDSVTSYMSYTQEADLQYIKDGWALDDEEAAVLHNSRKGTFNYMISMVRDNNLPGDLTLTENAVENLVRWKNNDNVVGRIQFLESNRSTYQSYGGYWLILAESYYEHGDYEKCLSAIDEYEALGTRIFRRDYEFARVLPLAISALEEVCDNNEYVSRASVYAQAIIDNTDHDDWALRYFVAQTYVYIHGITGEKTYLQMAYDIVLDNVNYLVGEQRAMNAAYLAPVQETATPKDANNSEKNQISNYNRMLKENRKKELIPISEPLLLNCDMLFALSSELDLPESEALKIDGILHPRGEPIFLNAPLDALYWAIPQQEIVLEDEFEFAGTALRIPASLVTSKTKIQVSVLEVGAETPDVFEDWTLSEVSRQSDTRMTDIKAVYTSESAKNHEWKPDATIIITVTPLDGNEAQILHYEYRSVSTKNEWYDYLKVWEGHKNNWYDYLKVWDNSVNFERVTPNE